MTDQDCQEIARALGIPADLLPDVLRDAGVRRAVKKAVERAQQTPKKRGPQAAWTPAKKRQLARDFGRFAAPRRGTRAELIPRFIKAQGTSGRANSSRDGLKIVGERRLSNLIGEGEALLRFMADPHFRRWANALRANPMYFVRVAPMDDGRQYWKEVRAALKIDKTGDFAKIADQAEFAWIMGERALLGDSWRDSFITIGQK